MKHGMREDKHEAIHPNYQRWGLGGKKEIEANFSVLEMEEINEVINKLNLDLTSYSLAYANKISYYQGDTNPNLDAVLLRFQRKDGYGTGLNEEHISLIFDSTNYCLLGLTRMQTHLDRALSLSHQQVLQIAVDFLKIHAPDLVKKNTKVPELNNIELNERMVFSPALTIDNVELQWIDGHSEYILYDKIKTEVYGMKVKMFIPETTLWAWAVIDKNGCIETFERNISWDFKKMQRKTEMWLHDKWLLAHDIQLTPLDKIK